MKNILTVVILFIGVITIHAQGMRGTSNISDGFGINSKSTKGHQFLLKEWVIGYLVDNTGKLTEKRLLNYDIHYNKPTYKVSNDSKDVMVLDNELFSGFVLMDAKKRRYIFTKINGDQFSRKKKDNKYYQLIDAPNKHVIQESYKELKDPNATGWSSSRDNTLRASFSLKTYYYVLNKNGKYVKVKLSSGSVAKALKDKKKQVQSFIKSNKLKFKNTNDLVKVMNYYKTL